MFDCDYTCRKQLKQFIVIECLTPIYNFSVHLNFQSYIPYNILFHLSYLLVFKLDKGQLT